MNLEEKKIDSNVIYKGRIINVYNDKVLLPNNNTSYREYVTHNGGSAIVPITEDNCVLLVEQYRYPYAEVVLEIPAGKLEGGENPRTCAIRELKEEVGGVSENIIDLGVVYPSPGYTNEHLYIFLATNVKVYDTHFDDDEFLMTKKLPISDAIDMIMNNKIYDAKTIIGILKAKNYLDSQRKK